MSHSWKCSNLLCLIGYFTMQTIWIDKEFGKYWSLQKHLKLSERINELKKNKKIKNCRDRALFVALPTLLLRSCNIEALWGSCWLIVLAPFRFPVLQVFPGLPDLSSCSISDGNSQTCTSLNLSSGKSCPLYEYSCCRSGIVRLWGIHSSVIYTVLYLWG